ncbi:MAG: UDP-N-acetylmuramoyl-tripeptide--D-alanyl-D-alanine ligase [Lautropia sp.]
MAIEATRFTLREAYGWLGDAVLHGRGDEPVVGVCTDTRRIAPGQLFVALRGDRFDAHAFVSQAIAAGVAAVVVERAVPGLRGPALRVPDTRRALGEIAAGWRARFALPLIAVTGSNGKTTVKEMISSILRAHVGEAAAFATRGNLNNDVGVPLTLLALDAGHRAGVVELGMNHPGEIAQLARFVRPTVALVNNAQREHQEFMDGPEATARENGTVFDALGPDGVAVFPADDIGTSIWRGLARGRRVLAFGLLDGASARCDAAGPAVYAPASARPDGFVATVEGTPIEISLAIGGRHNVLNALAAAACCHAIGVAPATIAAGLAAFRPASGRLARHVLAEGRVLIDDSYNANPDSVRAAIDALADERAPRAIVLGDMGEVGDQGPAFHREVGAYARDRGIETLIAVGAASVDIARGYGERAVHVATVESLVAAIAPATTAAASQASVPRAPVPQAALDALDAAASTLVKGSRFMGTERVVAALGARGRVDAARAGAAAVPLEPEAHH